MDFVVKDIIHKITARFVPAYLPEVKKPCCLRTSFQPEPDIHGIAGKADIYNIEADPKVIEDDFSAFRELILYLATDLGKSNPDLGISDPDLRVFLFSARCAYLYQTIYKE
jgi:hypothetical protein